MISFFKFNFDYDKRNQKFKTTDGFRSNYNINVPIISDTNTLTNTYNYKVLNEFFENNITSFSIIFKVPTLLQMMMLNYQKDYLYHQEKN